MSDESRPKLAIASTTGAENLKHNIIIIKQVNQTIEDTNIDSFTRGTFLDKLGRNQYKIERIRTEIASTT